MERSQLEAPCAGGSEDCSEKQATAAVRVGGMTESPSAEVALESKDGRFTLCEEKDPLDDLWVLFGEDPGVDNESAGDAYDIAGADGEEGARDWSVFHDGAATEPASGWRPHSEEAQFAAETVDKGIQCEFEADFMYELHNAHVSMCMEVVGLAAKYRSMLGHTQ